MLTKGLCSPSASVLTKSVAEMTLRLAYILNVAFVALYHLNEIGRRAADVIRCASLFVHREKSVKCCSLCNERAYLEPISVATESSRSLLGFGRGGGGELPAVFGPDEYVEEREMLLDTVVKNEER